MRKSYLINIYRIHKPIKITKMGCGCKNNGGQQQGGNSSQVQVQTQQQQNNESVKATITKIVEKYYNKK